MKEPIIVITAIIVIAALSMVALIQSIDGALLATAFTIVGGLAGYQANKVIKKRKEPPE